MDDRVDGAAEGGAGAVEEAGAESGSATVIEGSRQGAGGIDARTGTGGAAADAGPADTAGAASGGGSIPAEIDALNEAARGHAATLRRIHSEISKVVVGQDEVIEKLIVALVAQGHVLLEGVPGLAKTLLVKTLAECVECRSVRLQFTPDLLPADITGTKVYDHSTGSFSTVLGPVFTNLVLADEINRAPPKVQSALLEAMQEGQVSIQGETHSLARPFFVMATQNPIESEGTYRLPEAQMDRFMFKLLISHPRQEEEEVIIRRFTEGVELSASAVVAAAELLGMQDFARTVYADAEIRRYVARIVDATRHPGRHGIEEAAGGRIEHGASPRASIWITLGAKAHALLRGRGYVEPDDVRAVARDVLRHRILLSYEAEADGTTPDGIITAILDRVETP